MRHGHCEPQQRVEDLRRRRAERGGAPPPVQGGSAHDARARLALGRQREPGRGRERAQDRRAHDGGEGHGGGRARRGRVRALRDGLARSLPRARDAQAALGRAFCDRPEPGRGHQERRARLRARDRVLQLGRDGAEGDAGRARRPQRAARRRYGRTFAPAAGGLALSKARGRSAARRPRRSPSRPSRRPCRRRSARGPSRARPAASPSSRAGARPWPRTGDRSRRCRPSC